MNDLAIVEAEGLIPVPGAKELEANVRRYQEMQHTLDKLLPNEIVETGKDGKKYRRKGYWKAIAQGFSLNVELVKEERQELTDGDFGYVVTYKATDPRTNRTSDGDGACFASEKSQRRGGIGGTEHNVRAHAHTRATNRAISNLVAFGEVSAEEIENTERGVPETPKRKRQKKLPEATLEQHDGPEFVKDITAGSTWSNGTTVHKITTNKNKYTTLKDDLVDLAETALRQERPVEIAYQIKKTKKNADGEIHEYKAMTGLSLLQEEIDETEVDPETNTVQASDALPVKDNTPDEDEIPF
jgi:hypothetical protein